MKNLITAFVMFFAVPLFAQDTDCDDPNKILCCRAANATIVAITPLSELKCKAEKAHLYNIFPKIPIYKEFLFNQINHCSSDSKSTALLEFQYCIAKTRLHMTVTISDFNDPFYKTDVGASQVNLYKTMFQVGTSPILRTYPSNNKKFDQSFIAMPSEREHFVTYEGMYKNRYFVHIVVDGDRFKLASEVDAYLKDYIDGFNL